MNLQFMIILRRLKGLVMKNLAKIKYIGKKRWKMIANHK